MTILIKGSAVSFEMDDGRWIRAQKSSGIIHDPDGKVYPRCEVFVGPYSRTQTSVPLTSDARKYFGPGFDGKAGFVDVPTGPWKSLGRVIQIRYTRTNGSEHEGNYYHHFKKGQQVELGKCRSFYRLMLPRGCVVNYRGFVFP